MTTLDNALVTDLRLTIENTGSLYPSLSAVRKALLIRQRKKTYVAAKADKAFSRIVATGAKQYMRDVQGSRVTPAERAEVCKQLRHAFEERAAAGDFDWLLPPSMQGVGFAELGVGAEFHLTPGGQKFKKTGDRAFVAADGTALKLKRGARRRVHRAPKAKAKKAAKPRAKKARKPKAKKSAGKPAAKKARKSKSKVTVRKRAKLPKSAQGIGSAKSGPSLSPGYMYILNGDDWKGSTDEDWDTEMRSDARGAKFVGQRRIDNTMCRVFKLGKVFAAATLAATGGH